MGIEREHRNRWFEEYAGRMASGVRATARKAARHRYPCPCCGYPTLPERGGLDICQLCAWEDDGQDNDTADAVWGGPNGEYSLSRARENFRLYLNMYDKGLPLNIQAADTEIEKAAKRAMIRTFDKMIGEDDAEKLDMLWKEVARQKRILTLEMNKRIKAYEAGISAGKIEGTE